MSAIPPSVTTTLAHADANASPLTVNELIDVLNPLFSSVINGSYIPYIIQAGVPGVDQQGYAWIETDAAGRPISLRTFYNGHWRRVYNGMLGEIRMYSGNPNDTATWDSNGHGVIGGTYDGWQICNGKNNAPDLSDKFICAATMNNKDHSGYDTVKGWQTFVNGKTSLQTGGSKDHMIVSNELPPFQPNSITMPDGTVLGPRSDVTIFGKGWKADPETAHTDPQAIVDVNYGAQRNFNVTIGHYGANPSGQPPDPQVPMPTVPPFYTLAFIIFQGYTT